MTLEEVFIRVVAGEEREGATPAGSDPAAVTEVATQ